MTSTRFVFKNQDSYLLQVDLPGVNKDDINIAVKNQQLQVTSKINLPEKPLIFGRRPDSEQHITYDLESDIDTESITAALANGILSITLPRKTTAQQIKIE